MPVPEIKKTDASVQPDIRPLDRNACTALGHVGHVESRNAIEAFSAMFNMVAQPPVNAVLWADAGKTLDRDMLKHLRAWRNQCTEETKNIPGTRHIYQSAADTTECLRERFQAATDPWNADFPPEQKKALSDLRDHILARVHAMRAAIPFKTIKVGLRLEGARNDRSGNAASPHLDGTTGWSLRLLEVLDSDPTLVFSNDSFEATRKDGPEKYGQKWATQHWKLPADILGGTLPAWQAPANSILMITNNTHPWKPILHSEPPCDISRLESTKRMLVVYDLAFDPEWIAKATASAPAPGL